MIYKTKPWPHQEKALWYLYNRDTAALYTDMGTGKTKIMIDLMQNRGFKRVVVVGTAKSCDVWEEQISIHGFEGKISCRNLHGLSANKKKVALQEYFGPVNKDMATGTKVIIVNYESIWREPIASYLLRKTVGINCIVCDESHRIKTPSSKCSLYLTKLGKRASCRYLVTGTPLAENPMDVYAQYRFLDPSIFGTNFGNFKARYQNLNAQATAACGFPVLDKKQPYIHLDELHDKMFSCAFYVESSVELPEQTDITYHFKLPKPCQRVYKKLQDEGVICLNGKYIETDCALTMVLKLQQMTSGFAVAEPKYQDSPDCKRTVINLHRERVEALKDLLEGLPKHEPVVVFANYRKDLKVIRNLCREMKLGYSEVSGTEDTLKEWKASKATVLGVQYSSGSESIDLTRARYCIYYSLTRKLSLYLQSRKRIHRPGQTRPVVYYHIIGQLDKGVSMDELMMEALVNKQDIVDYVMERGIGKWKC